MKNEIIDRSKGDEVLKQVDDDDFQRVSELQRALQDAKDRIDKEPSIRGSADDDLRASRRCGRHWGPTCVASCCRLLSQLSAGCHKG